MSFWTPRVLALIGTVIRPRADFTIRSYCSQARFACAASALAMYVIASRTIPRVGGHYVGNEVGGQAAAAGTGRMGIPVSHTCPRVLTELLSAGTTLVASARVLVGSTGSRSTQ